MSGELLVEIDRVATVLDVNSVILPPDWRERVRAALAADGLGSLGSSEPRALIDAHFRFMGTTIDDACAILYLHAFGVVLASNSRSSSFRMAFSEARKNLFATRIFVNRKLASRCFHEARRQAVRSDDAARWLLQRSIDANLEAVGRDDRATDATERMAHSQIATACAQLARLLPRDSEARLSILRTGALHSREAAGRGERNFDHAGYAIEIALRLNELTGEDSFGPIGTALSSAAAASTATIQGLLGDVEYARAWMPDVVRPPDKLRYLSKAIDHYDRAIEAPHDDDGGADVGYHLAKRGRAHSVLYVNGADSRGRRDSIHLDQAIGGWLDPRSDPHRHPYELARLIRARARIASSRSDVAGAGQDLEVAANLLSDQDRPGSTLQLASQSLGVELETSMDGANKEAVIEALVASSVLPPVAPVPSGQMAKAVAWLRSRVPDPDWRELAEAALDRVEVDTANQALTVSARGHVIGHAAGIARGLYVPAQSGEMEGLLRAVQLSRLQVASAESASAATLSGASWAAYEYARLQVRSGASEDELGMWLDALLWGTAALRSVATVRTTAELAVDVVGCATRVCDSALRLAKLTGDLAPVATANDALDAALTRVQDERVEHLRSSNLAFLSTHRHISRSSDPATEAARRTAGGLSDEVHQAWRTLFDADQTRGDAALQLKERAARLFCRLVDDGEPTIGGKKRTGQRGVRTSRDPFGLSQSLVVMKRVGREAARREFNVLRHLYDRVRGEQSPTWRVPEPLGVVDAEGDDAVLVMRRMTGYTLAHHAMDSFDRETPDVTYMFAAAVVALGDFHALLPVDSNTQPEDVLESFVRASRVAAPDVDLDGAALLAPLLTCSFQVAKKDAHPGNWVWSAVAGGLVMIDAEGAASRPVLLEFSTLLDDLPILSLDSEGWRRRGDLALSYL